jgi:transposase-like protein
LGDEHHLSGKQTFLRVDKELALLPKNEWVTQTLCDPKRFSGILVMDGKYVAVKGFTRKVPFLFGLDYFTHDLPLGMLCVAEDEMHFSRFFARLKQLGYDAEIVVADDRAGLKQALLKVFPYARLQLCHNHYLENIRRLLRVRTEERYRHFFHSLKRHVFTEGTSEERMENGLAHVLEHHAQGQRALENILSDIRYRRDVLFAYLERKDCPNNTNLMELYNSHLNGRLKTIKGFQSFVSAARWLNAWMLRRRTKAFTDCEGKFKHLNGHPSLALSIQKQARWPDSLTELGIPSIPFFEKSDENTPSFPPER